MNKEDKEELKSDLEYAESCLKSIIKRYKSEKHEKWHQNLQKVAIYLKKAIKELTKKS